MKNLRKSWLIGLFATAISLLLVSGPVQADLISNSYVRDDKKIVVVFTEGSGIWTVPTGVSSLEVLVVGGGAGSSVWSCGAGSGGAYYTSTYTLSGRSVNIVVGAGGAAGGSDGNSNPGGSSSFDGMLIAYGGTLTNGYGTGGDSGGYSTDGGTTIVPGYAGGPNDVSNSSGAGARNPGLKGNTQHGGDGLQCSITGSATYYGGGGGANNSYADGGGLGGGGGGPPAIYAASLPGVDNLGGGAGGSWGGAGASGGSGVVVIAYTEPPSETVIMIK